MSRTYIIIIGLFLFFSCKSTAQDIHYSQFDFIPTFLNPSLSGLDHDMRLGLIYRDQGLRVTNNSYKSFTAFIDGPMYRGWRNGDHGGLGFSLLRDVSGVGGLETLEGLVNFAYHMGLDGAGKHFLSFAPQYVFIQRSIGDRDAFLFEEEINGGNLTEDLGELSKQYHDLNLGISYRYDLGDSKNFQAGYTFHHVNNSSEDSLGIIEKFGARHNMFVRLDLTLGKSLVLEPKIQYQSSEQFRELILQNNFGIYVNEKRNSKINIGVGYRTQDALEFMLGWENENYEIGIAYDVNTSNLNQVSNPVAGLEVGIKYRWPVERMPDLIFIPFIHKPRFSLITPDRILDKNISFALGEPSMEREEDANIEENESLADIPRKIIIKDNSESIPFDPASSRDVYALDKIFYNFDDAGILPSSDAELHKLLKVLEQYPSMRIELGAHTDARGDDLYNKDLSLRRAVAAKNWLVRRGIKKSRLVAVGYGEEQHVNDCSNGVDCTSAQHRKNRRTEFKILNY